VLAVVTGRGRVDVVDATELEARVVEAHTAAEPPHEPQH